MCASSPRIVPCDHCGTEGRLRWASYRFDQYGNEMEHEEPCPSCEGTGGEIIETLPVNEDDLIEMEAWRCAEVTA